MRSVSFFCIVSSSMKFGSDIAIEVTGSLFENFRTIVVSASRQSGSSPKLTVSSVVWSGGGTAGCCTEVVCEHAQITKRATTQIDVFITGKTLLFQNESG